MKSAQLPVGRARWLRVFPPVAEVVKNWATPAGAVAFPLIT